ncbi:MAG TPA: cation diffusion facilitator family transporter [Acidimicrobiales bacterium]|nr:cation diffusion facilitator family transporter [Acidimicrobiales bacterium]
MSAPQPLHAHQPSADAQRLRVALALVSTFIVVEIAVGVVARSLALWADAGHLLVDAGALAGALWAMRVATRPATTRWTFGLKRAEILAAAANGVTLLVVGVVLAVEAVQRLIHPAHVRGGAMVVVAAVGVGVNVAAAAVLAKGSVRSMNVRAAYLHVLTDLFGLLATAVAGAVILGTGWNRADPLASLAVVGVVLFAAWRLLRSSGHVLLEGTPEAVDLDEVRRHLEALDEVVAVHDLHAWVVTSDQPAVTAHVVVTDECLADGSAGRLLDRIQACLSSHFDVAHSTFQIEALRHLDHERGLHD